MENKTGEGDEVDTSLQELNMLGIQAPDNQEIAREHNQGFHGRLNGRVRVRMPEGDKPAGRARASDT